MPLFPAHFPQVLRPVTTDQVAPLSRLLRLDHQRLFPVCHGNCSGEKTLDVRREVRPRAGSSPQSGLADTSPGVPQAGADSTYLLSARL